MSVGYNIKQLRKNKNLTQKQLAEKAGLAEISIRRYEKGTNEPSTKILKKIATALGVPIENILVAELDTITKNFRNMADTQNELMKKTLEITKDNTGKIAFQYLCKTCGIDIDTCTNQFDEDIKEYNIKFKTEDFNISEDDFQRLFKTACNFIVKEVISSKYYDFIDE
ncbi:helix-turn-helix domain-containing protein [Clostridium botulinum]|uniref:helix-turn-helix domain-containing protein n=1 Tax=Clostridium botulinum TaxID=1491 RepID=UPI0007738D66|nr:helix-turn-helix transcriptional regulator [Clostridium botulinum]MBY6931281.1 helix-turn-helix transcriptional regulator [Clostridium botulinum]NFG19802.1 helix-turn-helix transcriptional regulator [Clostridium botulinum]NFO79876.1 helix-turn-helix transcriptional regulator [Clostridium botulinum]